MSTEFCPDCGRERAKGDEVISISPDPGWVAEFAMQLGDGEAVPAWGTEMRNPDGSRWNTWREPLIGWAVTEQHYGDESGHDRGIEPVLLTEDCYPVTMTGYRDNLHDKEKVRTRITRADGGQERPGSGWQS